MKIIDISQEILSCRVYPDDPKPEARRITSTQQGDCCNLSAFSMCAHNGTHIDAPFHFLSEGKTIDQVSLYACIGMCYVTCHNGNVTAEDAHVMMEKAIAAGAGERILIAGNAVVTETAAKVFAEAGIRLIGNEGQSVGPMDSPMEVHKILLEKEVVLLEGIVLSGVSEGKYFLSAAPLDIAGFDGAPCRAYLIHV